MRHYFALALAAAIALTLTGLPAAAQNLGGYSATLAADDVKIPEGAQFPPDAMVGTWSVTFASDHTCSVKHEGIEHVTCKYTIKGDEIAFTDVDGDHACKGGDSSEPRPSHSGPSSKFDGE